ncbi:MAG: hypothetical protein P9M03_07850 [Candidatus Theseobacter exili]|nr:hypothetical protein [Candidatus Theseobacter exili]
MPVYKNTTGVTQIASGITFAANEQKEVECYLYDKDLELITESPYPAVIVKSGTFSLDTGEKETVLTDVTEECLLDIAIQAPDGGIKLYHNYETNKAIIFEGVYTDQISTKYLKRIIIEATVDGVEGSYFIKKVR